MQYHVGHVIRDYSIEAMVGRGGFAEVYRARQRQINREVALKVVLPQHANNASFLRRFEREAKFIARVEHPHIVPLYDYWHDANEGAFLVMRWLDSGSLRQRLRTRSLSLREAVTLIQQIGSALTVAHANGVVHRDLKPDNILYDRYDNAYLTDFGIAKDIANVDGPSITLDGIVGTPAYIAPEQITGHPVTPRTDIYTLGLVLYECIVGEHPYKGNEITTSMLLFSHLNDPIPDVALSDDTTTNHLNSMLARATAKSPDARFEDVRAFVSEVETLLTVAPPALLDEHVVLKQPGQTRPFVTEAMTNVSNNISTGHLSNLSINQHRHFGDLKATIYRDAASVFKRPRKLIGRESLVAQLHAAIAAAEPVLVHGYGGLGKTSLVATVIAEHLERTSQPVIWLEAGYGDATRLFEAIAAAFDERDNIARLAGDEQIAAVRSLLHTNRMPIVLDDVWNEQALFQFMKAVPIGLPMLITSRYALPIDGELIDIGTLSTDRAVELLTYYSRRTFDNDKLAQRLCVLVGNHTFAVEIAGKHLKVEPNLTLGDLVERIERSPHRLNAPANYADVGRRGVEDLLDESYAALDSNCQRLLTAMGGLPALASSSALLATLLNRQPDDIELWMGTLAQRGLVTIESISGIAAARIHELTHSYARHLFRASTMYGKLDAVLQTFVENNVNAFDLLEFEQANILGLLDNQRTAALTKIDVMRRLVMDGYLTMRGHSDPFMRQMDQAIMVIRQRNEPALLHQFLSKRGNIAYDRGDLEKAYEYYQEALDIAVKHQMPDREVILCCVIAKVRVEQGRDDADSYLDRAERQAVAQNDDFLRGWVYENRGYVAQVRHDFGRAADYFNSGVELCRRLADDEGLYFALLNLGTAQAKLNLFAAAEKTLVEALGLARQLDQNAATAQVLESLGSLQFQNGRPDAARHNFVDALRLFKQSGQHKEATRLEQFIAQHFDQNSLQFIS